MGFKKLKKQAEDKAWWYFCHIMLVSSSSASQICNALLLPIMPCYLFPKLPLLLFTKLCKCGCKHQTNILVIWTDVMATISITFLLILVATTLSQKTSQLQILTCLQQQIQIFNPFILFHLMQLASWLLKHLANEWKVY